MELFVVKNRNGDVVKNGITSKSLAKSERDALQASGGKPLPSKETRDNRGLWDYVVSKGKNHFLA